MNCISDFVCEYHSKYGLIENVNIISINNDDCALNIFSNKSLIRTSIVNVKILSKPHENIYEIDKLDLKQDLILSIDNYSCMVKAIKIHDDETIEVMSTSDLLLNNEHTKRVPFDHLSICGHYESFDALKSISIPMPCEYSRYFNNIIIFKPLLSHVKNTLIHWNAEELKLKVLAFDEGSLKKIEFLMPIFISQLSLLSCGKQLKSVDILSNYIVWEYQYENEEEANYAIGPKGSHILAVRNFRGIAGVVLTKSNRLRIIAENKYALKEARSLLEIKRESYMFDDSFIPILIGKNASRITELVNKAGLHCIHVPNCAWNGMVNEHVTVCDPSMHGKRELLLFGTHDSINSAKLLLEMEESVKDLKKEFELRKNSKLRQSLSLKSSTSSISKESEKQASWDKMQEEVFEDPIGYPDGGGKFESSMQPLAWADMQDESGDETKCSETLTNITGIDCSSGGGGYTDFFSSQTNAARDRRLKKNQNWNQQKPHSPDTRNRFRQQKRITRKPPKQLPPGGLLFTNSTLSQGILNDDDEQQFQTHPTKLVGQMRNNRGGSTNQPNWITNSNFRSKNADRRPVYHAAVDDSSHSVQNNQATM